MRWIWDCLKGTFTAAAWSLWGSSTTLRRLSLRRSALPLRFEQVGQVVKLVITSCMNFLQTGRISLLKVALNIITCFSWGVLRKISWTSRRMSVWQQNEVIANKYFRNSSLQIYLELQASCRTRPRRNAWVFSNSASSYGLGPGSDQAFQRRCAGSWSSGLIHPLQCLIHQKILQPTMEKQIHKKVKF